MLMLLTDIPLMLRLVGQQPKAMQAHQLATAGSDEVQKHIEVTRHY